MIENEDSLLKNRYNQAFFDFFCGTLGEVYSGFDKYNFLRQIYIENWRNLELKERMKHIAQVLIQILPNNYNELVGIIRSFFSNYEKKGIIKYPFELMFIPEIIEKSGLNYFEKSVEAFEFITPFTSCEFAVRPFIIKYGETMIEIMEKWSKHPNEHVRRLASEGSRPRLPWAIALPEFKKNPTPILTILENLKTDPSEYVRRSVANSINDIAKDNPEIVIEIAQKWKNISSNTDSIIKHGCRTLLKQGNPIILEYFGLNLKHKVELLNFKIENDKVKLGGDLFFNFELNNLSSNHEKIRLEYKIYFQKNNGELSGKIFKITDRIINANESINFRKKHSFRIITTRKYYPGIHKITIVINGMESDFLEFLLTT